MYSSDGARNKRHSAYRSCTVVIEYRWHPLYGKKVALFRRTGRRGSQVVHLELNRKFSRELPAWMVDASVCGGMSKGPPQSSAIALSELRAVISSLSRVGGSLDTSTAEGTSNEAEDEAVKTPTRAIPGTRGATRNNTGSKGRAADSTRRSPPRGAGRRAGRSVKRGRK